MSSELPLKAASLNTVGMFQRCKRTSPALFDYLVDVGENRRRSLSSGRIRVTRWLAMTAVAHSAPIYEFESSRQDNGRRRSCRSRAPSFGRHPPHRRFCMQSWPQAARLLLFAVPCYDCPVTSHYKCSLPAQFPMKSVATPAADGLGSGSCKTGDSRKGPSATVRCAKGRRRTSCAIDATVAGAVLR